MRQGWTGQLWVALLLAGSVPLEGCGKDEGDKAGGGESAPAKGAEPATTPAPPPAATGEDLVKRLEGCWAAFSAWDKEKLRTCYADKTDVTSMDAVPPASGKTPQEVLVTLGSFRNAFPDFKADLQIVLVNGHKAAVVALFTGTHKGRSLGLPPTNKRMNLFYGQAVEVDDKGAYIRERTYADQMTLIHQLGIQEGANVPASEEPLPEKARVVGKNDETEKANLAAFKASFEALGKRDAAGATAAYADDAVYRYVPQSTTIKGPKEILRARDYSAVARNYELSLRDAWTAGDWVVAETTHKGTLDNDIGGVKGTKGKSWEQNALELIQFEGGKIKRHLVYANGLKFAVDVGLFDPASIGM